METIQRMYVDLLVQIFTEKIVPIVYIKATLVGTHNVTVPSANVAF